MRRCLNMTTPTRGLSLDRAARASWHAKCLIADDEVSFVTSANFTEWAQQRSVEAGVLIRSRELSLQLRSHFDALVRSGTCNGCRVSRRVRRGSGWL